MQVIVFSAADDRTLFDVFSRLEYHDGGKIQFLTKPSDFKEAVRKNIAPKPVIVFSASDRSSYHHLSEIKKYITDSILLLIVPNEAFYQDLQKEMIIYPRYIFYQEDDRHLMMAMLNNMIKKWISFPALPAEGVQEKTLQP